jgi:hypothetical protein
MWPDGVRMSRHGQNERMTAATKRALGLTVAAVAGALAALMLGGGATFAQDPASTETTQTTTTTTTATPPPPVAHTASLTAKLRIKLRHGAFVGTGPVAGKPFGKGKFKSRSTVHSTHPLRIHTTLTGTWKAGTIVFKGTATYVGSTYKGTFHVSRGTGAYAKATGKNLKVTDRARNGIDTLKLKGKITYPDAD